MNRILFLIALFLMIAAAPSFALKIAPFKASMEAGDPAATEVFRVENNTDESAAVQVSVTTWDIAEDGTEINAAAENDFVIFPAQVVLKPHESRAVRVQYQGGRSAGEKSYRLVAEQLPVTLQDTPGSGSAVKFMLKFKAALYVSAATNKPDISIVEAVPNSGKLRLLLANRGTAHAVVHAPKVTLILGNGEKRELSGDILKPLEGENIHAGRRRFFDIALPLPDQKISSAKLDFTPAF